MNLLKQTYSETSTDAFQKILESRCGRKIKMRVNDNHSTMLSVRWEPDHTRVSLHRMFLSAPTDVVDALAYYLKKSNHSLAPSVKAYIAQYRQKLDYSGSLDPRELKHEGRIYNLKKIYNDINEEYFEGKLRLNITWFGESVCRNKTRISFGLYHDTLRLIKINRILDKRYVPEYFIRYVIFHEMLHHVCPPHVDEGGTNRIHSNEFKRREKHFAEYHQAIQWIRNNRNKVFGGA